jgi:DNA-binding protein
MSEDKVYLAGIGQAVFLACTSTRLAGDLMAVSPEAVTINYVQYPALGRFEAIVFTLGRASSSPAVSKMAELDGLINPSVGDEGQVVAVSKTGPASRMALFALFKLKRHDRIKILGAGGAINQAVSVALMLTRGQLAKTPVGIEHIGLTDVDSPTGENKKTTGINIYLRKDFATSYPEEHLKIIEQIQSGQVA